MFSELVDICVARSGMPNKQADTVAYANQTIRDMQAKQMLGKNFNEDITVTSSHPHAWTPPVRFQRIRAAHYPSVNRYPEFLQPGAILVNKIYYFYRSTTVFIFNGHATVETIGLGYYRFQKKLDYFAPGLREAVYDFGDELWAFPIQAADRAKLVAEGATDTELAIFDAAALLAQPGHISNASNWLLLDWFELVQEGTLAKIFKLVADTERAATHFSFFERSYQESFLVTERDTTMPS